MRKVMKIRIAISSILLILPSIAEGQAVPTAVVPVSSVGGSPIVPNLDGMDVMGPETTKVDGFRAPADVLF